MPSTLNRHPGEETASARIFVVGAPRSGTTWLQLLLAQHPRVATAQETHLFERYLAHLDHVWRWEASFEAERAIGLRPLLSEEDFHGLCRAFADGVLARLDPGGTRDLVLEKTPGHVLSARFIHALFPDAWFLHVIRDPRAVVASLLRAGEAWGRRWAPRGPVTAARVWTEHVEAGLAIPRLSDRYLEVRYEALHEEGPVSLLPVLEALGLAADEAWCRKAFEACDISRLRRGEADAEIPWEGEEPDGFYGPGKRDAWHDELGRAQVRAVEFVAGEAMARLGYERITEGDRAPFRVVALRLLERLRSGLDWRLRRAAAGL